jgi:hypothetical protein
MQSVATGGTGLVGLIHMPGSPAQRTYRPLPTGSGLSATMSTYARAGWWSPRLRGY